jgi:hypothetical protein
VYPSLFNMLKKYIKCFKLEFWMVLLSITISSVFTRYFVTHIDFTLKNFTGRTIGIVVLAGVDASLKTKVYVLAVLLFSLLFIFSILMLNILNMLMDKSLTKHSSIAFNKEKSVIFTASLYIVFALFLYIFSSETIFVTVIKILAGVLLISFFVISYKILICNFKPRMINTLPQGSSYTVITFIPFTLYFIRQSLLHGEVIITKKFTFIYICAWVLLFCLYHLSLSIFDNKTKKEINLQEVIAKSLIPLALIPVSLPFINELQFTLSHYVNISTKILSILVFGILIILSAAVFYTFIRRKTPKWSTITSDLNGNFYFPLIIITFVIYKNYMHSFIYSNFDFFHHGENLITTQQLFEFGKIPFINIYPTHGFSNIITQILYSFINGYSLLEPWLWNWIYPVLEFILIYFLLYKITDSFNALILTLFIPIFVIVPTYFSFFVLPALASTRISKSTTKYNNYIWIICFITLLWRIDFGIATIASMMILTLLDIISRYLNKTLNLKAYVKYFISPLIILSFISITAFIILAKIGNESIKDIVTLILDFIKIQAPSMSFVKLANKFSSLIIVQYIILPAVGVFYVIHFFKKIVLKEIITKEQIILFFIACVSLIQSTRSTQRHSLVEGYQPYMFVFLLAALPFYFKDKFKKKEVALIIFNIIFAFYILIFPDFNLQIPSASLFKFHNWNNGENRIVFAESPYDETFKFLKDNLTDANTFYEFTNMPMSYVITNKNLPTYYIPTLYLTSDSVQDSELKRISDLHNKGNLPFIIFKQENDWDAIDKVPNEIRSYKIAEFIYKNYKPLGNIGRVEIWVDKNYTSKINLPINYKAKDSIAQTFDLMKLPYIWGNFDPNSAVNNTALVENLTEKAELLTQNKDKILKIKPYSDKNEGNYLHLKIKSDKPAVITLTYGLGSNITFEIINSEKPLDYLVRISSQWEWMNSNIDEIKLTSTENITLESVSIRKGD